MNASVEACTKITRKYESRIGPLRPRRTLETALPQAGQTNEHALTNIWCSCRCISRFKGVYENLPVPSEWKYFRTSKEGVMNVLPVALVIFAVVVLAGVLWFGLATLQQIRARRQRLQMKRHLQSIERVG